MRSWRAVAVALIACTPRGESRVEATWTGATDSGRLVAPAVATWCGTGKYVEIVAIQGDTGLALMIAPGDTIRPGRYAVAALALRWPKETSIRGFRGDTGTVVLRHDPDGTLSGDVDARGRLVGTGRPRLDVNVSFRQVPIRTAAATCGSSVDSGNGDHLLPEGVRP